MELLTSHNLSYDFELLLHQKDFAFLIRLPSSAKAVTPFSFVFLGGAIFKLRKVTNITYNQRLLCFAHFTSDGNKVRVRVKPEMRY